MRPLNCFLDFANRTNADIRTLSLRVYLVYFGLFPTADVGVGQNWGTMVDHRKRSEPTGVWSSRF